MVGCWNCRAVPGNMVSLCNERLGNFRERSRCWKRAGCTRSECSLDVCLPTTNFSKCPALPLRMFCSISHPLRSKACGFSPFFVQTWIYSVSSLIYWAWGKWMSRTVLVMQFNGLFWLGWFILKRTGLKPNMPVGLYFIKPDSYDHLRSLNGLLFCDD